MEYTHEEYADIIFIYGFCNGNALAACREYQRRFPNRRHPSPKVFTRSYLRLRQCGIAQRPGARGAGGRHAAEEEVRVINAVLDQPTTTTRRIATQLRYSQSFVWRTLHQEVLHPYHRQNVQSLLPGDEMQRRVFCEWLLEMNTQNVGFPNVIFWSDESLFTRNGIYNPHNEHVWSLENPRALRIRSFQHRFSINIWSGIFNGSLFMQVLPQRLNGNSYLALLENHVEYTILDDIPLATRELMWYQHDGAPPHISQNVVRWLNHHFGQRWIGRNGPVHWPARSPDLNPLDFFLWGAVKRLVYSEQINTPEQLQERINNAFHQIQATINFEQITFSLLKRCRACVRANGGIFEHLLK